MHVNYGKQNLFIIFIKHPFLNIYLIKVVLRYLNTFEQVKLLYEQNFKSYSKNTLKDETEY